MLELDYAHSAECGIIIVFPKRRKGVEEYKRLPLDVIKMDRLPFGLKRVQIIRSESFKSGIG